MSERPRRSDGTEESEPEPRLQGVILSPVGIVPGGAVLTTGRPKPEPDERWTLGPERKHDVEDGAAPAGDADAEAGDEERVTPVDPGRVTRSGSR